MRWRTGKIKVLFSASEVVPYSKTGGLADVTGALPLALEKLGVEVLVTTPRYRGLAKEPVHLSKNVTVCFIDNDALYNRSGIYGNEAGDYEDNLERFVYFCRQSLELAKARDFRPDVVHVHDWQASLMPVYLKSIYKNDPFFEKTRSILTVHNLAYQGQFSRSQYGQLGLPDDLFNVDGLEFYGKINLLKSGLLFADGLTTVSPNYAKEIQTDEFGFGLDGVVRKRKDALRGVLNGIDTRLWDPRIDHFTKAPFSAERIEGKAVCKAELQKHFGLEQKSDIPLFVIVSRMAEQKGWEIFSEIADAFLAKKVQLAVLGEGDAVYRTLFQNIRARHPKKMAVHVGFDVGLSHRMYAGADFFLMPSFFEPCGLGQMISLNYGTLPVVRKTGGLADTVFENGDKANGFVFEGRSPEAFLKAIERALAVYTDKSALRELQKQGMTVDFSWDASAKTYLEFYKKLNKA